MKTKSKLALLGLLAAPLAALAWSPEQAYLESYRLRRDLPVPTAVVMPHVGARYAGQAFTLRFVVDAMGRPRHIRTLTRGADHELAASVSRVVAAWKFKPLFVAGQPVARKVDLPVAIVASLPE